MKVRNKMLHDIDLARVDYKSGAWIIAKNVGWGFHAIIDASPSMAHYIGWKAHSGSVDGSVLGYLDLHDGVSSYFSTAPVHNITDISGGWSSAVNNEIDCS